MRREEVIETINEFLDNALENGHGEFLESHNEDEIVDDIIACTGLRLEWVGIAEAKVAVCHWKRKQPITNKYIKLDK